jgi:hypothetical protein
VRRTILAATALVLLVAACFAPGEASPTAVTAQRTQNVPSRGPLPTAQPFRTLDAFTFPPATAAGATPSPSAPPDPALVALVPSKIAGQPLQVISGRASDWGETGDMCGAFCPGEIQKAARTAGADPAKATWAAGYVRLASSAGVFIRAIRLPGATSSVVKAWIAAMPTAEFLVPSEVMVAGRRATLLREPLPSPSQALYITLVGDVAFSVVEAPGPAHPEKPSDLVIEAFSLLP